MTMDDLFAPLHTPHFSLRYENGGCGVVVTMPEMVTIDAILALHQHIYDPRRLAKLGYGIFDLRPTQVFDVRATELELIAQQDAQAHQINPHFVIAIVPSHAISVVQQNIFEIFSVAYADTLRKQLFSEFDIAHQWALECWHQEQCMQLQLAVLNHVQQV
jgi:hypothetical protein